MTENAEMTTETTTAPDTRLAGSLYDNPYTEEALRHLADKLEPLIQGQRMDNIVDILSMLSDLVDMTDEKMAEKAMNTWEDVMAISWGIGNAIRYAANEVEKMETPPSMLQLMKQMNDPDVRRGIAFMLCFMGTIGRQMKP